MTMFPYHYIMVHKRALDSMFGNTNHAVRQMMLQIMARTDQVHWRIRGPIARVGGPLVTLPHPHSGGETGE